MVLFQKLFQGYIFCFLGDSFGQCIFEKYARETNLKKERSLVLSKLSISLENKVFEKLKLSKMSIKNSAKLTFLNIFFRKIQKILDMILKFKFRYFLTTHAKLSECQIKIICLLLIFLHQSTP